MLSGDCHNHHQVAAHIDHVMESRGGVVVTGDDRVVAAVTGDRDDTHPLHHVAMILVDRVAAAQGGGVHREEYGDLASGILIHHLIKRIK